MRVNKYLVIIINRIRAGNLKRWVDSHEGVGVVVVLSDDLLVNELLVELVEGEIHHILGVSDIFPLVLEVSGVFEV